MSRRTGRPVGVGATVVAWGALGAVAAPARAQAAAGEPAPAAVSSLWGGGGVGVAIDAPGQARHSGPLGVVALEVGVPTRRWAVRAEVGVATSRLARSPFGEVTGDVQTPQAALALRIAARGGQPAVVPYAVAALTVARPSTQLAVHDVGKHAAAVAFEQTSHEVVPGVYGGAGVTLRIRAGLRAFAELRGQRHDTAGRSTTSLPLLAGVVIPAVRWGR